MVGNRFEFNLEESRIEAIPEKEMIIDFDLLFNIFRIPAFKEANSEIEMRNFVINRLDRMKIPYEVDEIGNVFSDQNMEGGFGNPLLCSHLDTVQFSEYESIIRDIDERYLTKEGILNPYIDEKSKPEFKMGKTILGGDDKCGIYIILKILEKHPRLNFLFSVAEESGTFGSNYYLRHLNGKPIKNIEHIKYGIVLDRKGNSDILCSHGHKNGSPEFHHRLCEIGTPFGYKPATGGTSDTNVLARQISMANLSCGYHSAHTTHEYISLSDVVNCQNFVEAIITQCGDKFEPVKDLEPRFKYINKITLPPIFGEKNPNFKLPMKRGEKKSKGVKLFDFIVEYLKWLCIDFQIDEETGAIYKFDGEDARTFFTQYAVIGTKLPNTKIGTSYSDIAGDYLFGYPKLYAKYKLGLYLLLEILRVHKEINFLMSPFDVETSLEKYPKLLDRVGFQDLNLNSAINILDEYEYLYLPSLVDEVNKLDQEMNILPIWIKK